MGKLLLLISIISICGLNALENDKKNENIRGLVGIGFDFGGDTMVSVSTTEGDKSISANDGMVLNFGLEYYIENDLNLRTTLGYKYNAVEGTNGSIDFSRIPFEMTVNKIIDKNRFGAGVIYYLSPELTCDISGMCDSTTPFDSSLGFVLRYEREFSISPDEMFSLGVKYNNVTFEHEASGTTFDSSGVGVEMNFYF